MKIILTLWFHYRGYTWGNARYLAHKVWKA